MTEPFTWERYRSLIGLAVDVGYELIGFADVASDSLPERALLLRHDVDYDPASAERMARIETEHRVRSTYFFQLDSPWYSIETATPAIRSILDGGHWLGLHLDANRLAGDAEIAEGAGAGARELADRYSTEVSAVSFHMPGRNPVGHIELPNGLLNTYAPRFFGEFGYVSDSNQDWRGKDLAEVLRGGEHRRLQVLIHPIWWRESYSPMIEKLTEVAAQAGVELDQLITPEQRELL